MAAADSRRAPPFHLNWRRCNTELVFALPRKVKPEEVMRDNMCTNKRPNVILVLTDDQGFGDLGCSGNPWISTPNIDRFSREAVCFADFHVHPRCTPTRGARRRENL